MNNHTYKPVEPFQVEPEASISNLLGNLAKTAFQARTLGVACDIWMQMLQEETTILLGVAGAMVPAGMRTLLSFLIRNHLIDCLVSTGANFSHDWHETIGNYHYQGSPHVSDLELQQHGLNRIYDIFIVEQEFSAIDKRHVYEFAETLQSARRYSSKEFLWLLGDYLAGQSAKEGILTTAAKERVPLFCPALADSVIGIGLGLARLWGKSDVTIDHIQDAIELAQIARNSKQTAAIFIGGGVPKNFIQQATIFFPGGTGGHKYAIQITTDVPHWGGLSGCTFEEGQSWGKIAPEAREVSVYCDATIAFPLLVTAVAERMQRSKLVRSRPRFTWGENIQVSYRSDTQP